MGGGNWTISPHVAGPLSSANAAVRSYDIEMADQLLEVLGAVAHEIEDATGMKTSITQKEPELERRRAARRATEPRLARG